MQREQRKRVKDAWCHAPVQTVALMRPYLECRGHGPYVRLSTVVVEVLDPKHPHPRVPWLEEGVDGLCDEAVNRGAASGMRRDVVA